MDGVDPGLGLGEKRSVRRGLLEELAGIVGLLITIVDLLCVVSA